MGSRPDYTKKSVVRTDDTSERHMKDCDKHRRMKVRDPRKPFAVLEEIGQGYDAASTMAFCAFAATPG